MQPATNISIKAVRRVARSHRSDLLGGLSHARAVVGEPRLHPAGGGRVFLSLTGETHEQQQILRSCIATQALRTGSIGFDRHGAVGTGRVDLQLERSLGLGVEDGASRASSTVAGTRQSERPVRACRTSDATCGPHRQVRQQPRRAERQAGNLTPCRAYAGAGRRVCSLGSAAGPAPFASPGGAVQKLQAYDCSGYRWFDSPEGAPFTYFVRRRHFACATVELGRVYVTDKSGPPIGNPGHTRRPQGKRWERVIPPVARFTGSPGGWIGEAHPSPAGFESLPLHFGSLPAPPGTPSGLARR